MFKLLVFTVFLAVSQLVMFSQALQVATHASTSIVQPKPFAMYVGSSLTSGAGTFIGGYAFFGFYNNYSFTVAGNGTRSGFKDGPALQSLFTSPMYASDVTFNNVRYTIVSDQYRIRSISYDANNLATSVSTIAGTGVAGFSGDGGLAINAQINGAGGITLGSNDNVYFCDTSNNRIRMIDLRTGIITTVAGTGDAGYSGDGGLATNAKLSFPASVAFNANTKELFIADTNNHAIRKVSSNGTITTVVGTGVPGYNGDGIASQSKLNYPYGLALFGATNEVYISDTGNTIIRVLYPNGMLYTVAGIQGYSPSGNTPLNLNNANALNVPLTSYFLSTIIRSSKTKVISFSNNFDGTIVDISYVNTCSDYQLLVGGVCQNICNNKMQDLACGGPQRGNCSMDNTSDFPHCKCNQGYTGLECEQSTVPASNTVSLSCSLLLIVLLQVLYCLSIQ